MTEAKELGLVCTVVPPALKTRNLDHPDLDRFYAAAADMGMALGVHGAPGIHLPKIGVDRFTNYIQVHCISFPFDQMTAMTALVSGGVFDRHPTLRVAFLEAGVGWLPWFMERLHEHYESRGDWIPDGWAPAGPVRGRRQHGGDVRARRERRCPTWWRCSATSASCSPATTRTGTGPGRGPPRSCWSELKGACPSAPWQTLQGATPVDFFSLPQQRPETSRQN